MDHPRARRILARYPKASVVPIDRYGEVFNKGQQDFALQKQNPALILAKKHGNFVLKAPAGYGIGAKNNYYFSHLLNCPYDCRYCFLQGMYRSAHHVLFVNYEDFEGAIQDIISQDSDACFFSGYDCDSLALESVTGFAQHFLPFFASRPQALFELRTKSTHTSTLLAQAATKNVVVALSLTPTEISSAHEHKTPRLSKRIQCAQKLAHKGYPIGLRFDPIIYHPELPQQYQTLMSEIAGAIAQDAIHSISLGPLRFPKKVHRTISRLYPSEALLAGPLAQHPGPGSKDMISYPRALEREMHAWVLKLINTHFPNRPLFSCTPESWDQPDQVTQSNRRA